MSTRGIIVVTGKTLRNQDRTVRLYKHCDSYPRENLSLISQAIAYARNQQGKNEAHLRVDRIVDFLDGKTDFGGTGARCEATFHEPFHPMQLGLQCDLEWLYLIDLEREAVFVYGGGYTGKVPSAAYYKGTISPLVYVRQLKGEYQADERTAIEAAIAAVGATGFTVNPSKHRTSGGTGNQTRAAKRSAAVAVVEE